MNDLITLTSLAMLKVNIDAEKRDYLEYLRPFVLHVLATRSFEFINDEEISRAVEEDFGLRIPRRTINRMLTRLAKKKIIEKDGETFKVNKSIVAPSDIESKRTKARLQIDRISKGLRDFSEGKALQITDDSEALEMLLLFLSKFSIDCLKTYIFGHTIPESPRKEFKYIVLISQFLKHIHTNDATLFDSFIVLMKGHMLANALTCPDLDSLQQTFSKVTFYLDTPLALHLLGLSGPEKEKAEKEIVTSARKLGAKVCIFSHTSQELYNVIRGAAKHLDSTNARGSIVREMRKEGKTYTDLILIAGKREEHLLQCGVRTVETPSYDDHSVQMDENLFENLLDEEIDYYNPNAKIFDVNSVRSIYSLRKGSLPCRLEDAKATFVTSNSTFAKIAFEYGKQYESTKEVSSVITDFSLANIAWLKSPVDMSDLPKAEILSTAYAALNPTDALWTKYLSEMDKLRDGSEITAEDHAILRCDLSTEHLMEMTLGEESALTSRGVKEILEATKKELTKEQEKKLLEERDQHEMTRAELDKNIEDLLMAERKLDRLAGKVATAILSSVIIIIMLIIFFIFYSKDNRIGNVLTIVISMASIYGLSIRKLLGLQRTLKGWLVKKISSTD